MGRHGRGGGCVRAARNLHAAALRRCSPAGTVAGAKRFCLPPPRPPPPHLQSRAAWMTRATTHTLQRRRLWTPRGRSGTAAASGGATTLPPSCSCSILWTRQTRRSPLRWRRRRRTRSQWRRGARHRSPLSSAAARRRCRSARRRRRVPAGGARRAAAVRRPCERRLGLARTGLLVLRMTLSSLLQTPRRDHRPGSRRPTQRRRRHLPRSRLPGTTNREGQLLSRAGGGSIVSEPSVPGWRFKCTR